MVRAGRRSALCLIGPEGDFTPEEEAAAVAAGCVPVSLGRSILRTETAAAAALAVIVQMAGTGRSDKSDGSDRSDGGSAGGAVRGGRELEG